MKNSVYIFILFCFQACSQTEIVIEEKPKDNLVIDLGNDSTQIFDDSKVGTFFSAIFSKYKNDYYVLGSGITFSEGITADEPNSYHSKSSFLVVDSLESGNNRYVLDITPKIVQKLSNITIYKGKYGCHWELSVDGCEWMGFIEDTRADFLFNSEDGGYDLDFIKSLENTEIKDDKNKEDFCSAILDVLSIDFAPDFTKCKRTKVEFKWNENKLLVTHHYSDLCTDYEDGRPKEEIDFKHCLEFNFENDRITQLKRK